LPGGDANSGLSFHVYPLSDDKVPVVMDKAEAWSAATGGALLNTEFGANPDPKFTDMNIKEFDRALIPWMHWAYNENTIEDLKAPPSDNEADNVDALVRPHPLAVGGTPTRLDYDLPTRVMRFTWDTTGPDGHTVSRRHRNRVSGGPTHLPQGLQGADRRGDGDLGAKCGFADRGGRRLDRRAQGGRLSCRFADAQPGLPRA
jgi:hypothetical protein